MYNISFSMCPVRDVKANYEKIKKLNLVNRNTKKK